MLSRPRRTAPHLVALLTGALLGGLLVGSSGSTAAADGVRAVTVDQTLDVLVLGDSYSAGNGATDEQGAEQTYGPDGCRRSRVNWGEKYAAALRAGGLTVRLDNHACSGGVTADIASPRAMDTSSRLAATPAGVTTAPQADAFLARTDPCNAGRFPDEEFWTYRATNVTAVLLAYDCTRHLRPQADFVDAGHDLVLFTMGGNDAGFSSIVASCFVPVLRTAASCRGRVDAARALLPQIRQRLLADVAALRAHGLREDAKLVQLGYPWLQQDNGFTLTDLTGTYDAGNQVRSLVSEGNAATGAIVDDVNVGHPGQLSFLTGVPEKFSGHEPDATTVLGNPARWINQVGDGGAVDVFYHPNRLGQSAYAELLTARGTFGAPTGPPPPATSSLRVTATLRARFTPRRVDRGGRVRVRARVRLSDRSRPRGRVVAVALPGRQVLASARVRPRHRGVVRLAFDVRGQATTTLRVVYRDRVAAPVRVVHRVRQAR